MFNSVLGRTLRVHAIALMACGSLCVPLSFAEAALPPTDIKPVLTPAQTIQQMTLNAPCIGNGPQPNVTRWLPNGRVWPGGKIVFEGQGLDASRFAAAVGSPRLALTIVSASPTRIEMQVPALPEGGPYTVASGEPLVVSYGNGCKVLNPAYVVADAFTLQTHEGGGRNRAYFSIRHQMDLDGEIEGARSVTILPTTNSAVRNLVPDHRDVCDWGELRPSGRTVTLTDNRIHHNFFGFFRDQRNPASSLSASCKLPVDVVIQNPFTNATRDEIFLVPMAIRTPRTVSVDTRTVVHFFDGVPPSLPPLSTATDTIGDCGKLYEGSPTGGPDSNIGVTVKNSDWLFTIRSGALPTKCRYVSRPVEANLGVAFGPFMSWDVANVGRASACHAQTSLETIGLSHELPPITVYLSCDPGPLGDNGVSIRATSINLLVPYEYMPPSVSLDVQN